MTNRWWHIIRVGVGHWNLRGEGETRVQALVVSDGTKMRKNIVDYYAHWRGGGGVPLGVRKRGKIFFFFLMRGSWVYRSEHRYRSLLLP